MHTVLLVDGSNLLFRAVYGLGEQSCAMGVILYLNDIWADVDPDSCVVCWDVSKSKARSFLYSEYKAGRKQAKAELDMDSIKVQQDFVMKYLEALGIVQIAVHGVEADDILSYVSEYCTRLGYKVVITSSDMDLWQLIDPPNVAVYDHRNNSYVTAATVEQKLGFKDNFSRIAEYKALVGDASDNIKGVKGIGEKAARSLFLEHGSLLGMRKAFKLLSKSKKTAKIFELEDDLERDLRLTRLPSLSAIRYWLRPSELSELSEQVHSVCVKDVSKAALYVSHLKKALQLSKPIIPLDLSGLLSMPDLSFYQDWSALDTEVAKCRRCLGVFNSPVLGQGHSAADIMFVFSEVETFDSEIIEAFMKDAGIQRDEVYFTSVVRCVSLDTSLPSLGQAARCVSFLQSEINLLRPKLVVTFGNLAMSQFTEYQSFVTKHCGEIGRFSSNRLAHSAIVAINVAPSSALRSGKYKAHLEYGAQRLKAFLIVQESKHTF